MRCYLNVGNDCCGWDLRGQAYLFVSSIWNYNKTALQSKRGNLVDKWIVTVSHSFIDDATAQRNPILLIERYDFDPAKNVERVSGTNNQMLFQRTWKRVFYVFENKPAFFEAINSRWKFFMYCWCGFWGRFLYSNWSYHSLIN